MPSKLALVLTGYPSWRKIADATLTSSPNWNPEVWLNFLIIRPNCSWTIWERWSISAMPVCKPQNALISLKVTPFEPRRTKARTPKQRKKNKMCSYFKKKKKMFQLTRNAYRWKHNVLVTFRLSSQQFVDVYSQSCDSFWDYRVYEIFVRVCTLK